MPQAPEDLRCPRDPPVPQSTPDTPLSTAVGPLPPGIIEVLYYRTNQLLAPVSPLLCPGRTWISGEVATSATPGSSRASTPAEALSSLLRAWRRKRVAWAGAAETREAASPSPRLTLVTARQAIRRARPRVSDARPPMPVASPSGAAARPPSPARQVSAPLPRRPAREAPARRSCREPVGHQHPGPGIQPGGHTPVPAPVPSTANAPAPVPSASPSAIGRG